MHNWWQQIPNALTLARLALAGPIVLLLLLNTPSTIVFALVLFLIAALTDVADGVLARRLNACSTFGTRLDPLADKALVLLPLAALTINGHLNTMALGAFALIAVREIFVIILRAQGAGAVIHVSDISKLKTVLQMVATAGFVIGVAWPQLFAGLSWLAPSFLAIAALLGLYSAYGYWSQRHKASAPQADAPPSDAPPML